LTVSTRLPEKPRRTLTVGRAGLALLALVAGLAFGRFAFFSAEAPEPAPSAAASSPQAVIGALEARVASAPDDTEGWQALGVAYVREGIRTGDPSLYGAAEDALDRADELAPDQTATLLGRGLLALTLHQFSEAERLGTLARQADPYSDEALAVLVDAAVELGRYDDATRHLDDLMALRPGLAAYSRQSYLRQLNGDLSGAALSLSQAETAGAGSAFDVATVVALEGDLHLQQGDLGRAADAYERALSLSPDVVAARVGRARVLAASGDIDAAIAELEDVTTTVPLPGALILLGELQDVAGRGEDATAKYELVRTVTRLQEAEGADVDLELALVETDHGDPALGLSLAQTAYANRPTIFAADAVAWALRGTGDAAGAVSFVNEALRLGTLDPQLHFHAATILADVGDVERAAGHLRTALELNPWFSFAHHDEATALAGRLGVAVPDLSESR
jgi:tetratricopeptide (TPR) repeat protein